MNTRNYEDLNYFNYWTRRGFLKRAGAFLGAGLLQPVISLIGSGKSIAAAYPNEVLSIEKYTKGKIKPGMVISKDTYQPFKDLPPEGLLLELQRVAQIKTGKTTMKDEATRQNLWTEP